MDNLKAPSLQSLLESDRGSNDSLLAESLTLDIEEVKAITKEAKNENPKQKQNFRYLILTILFPLSFR